MGETAPEICTSRPLCSDTSGLVREGREDGSHEPVAIGCEGVHHHLPVSSRAHETAVAERADVVGDQGLRAFADPRQVAHAQLVRLREGRSDRQPRGVGKRLSARGGTSGESGIEAVRAKPFRNGQIEAEEIAAIVGHTDNLTNL